MYVYLDMYFWRYLHQGMQEFPTIRRWGQI